jgi:hypothetical protein
MGLSSVDRFEQQQTRDQHHDRDPEMNIGQNIPPPASAAIEWFVSMHLFFR